MTTSLLNDCLLLRAGTKEKLREYLHSVNLLVFDPLFDRLHRTDVGLTVPQIILYILCAYSEDSPMIILRQDVLTEQNNICEFLQIPEIFRPDLINLKDSQIKRVAVDYVNQFAGPVFRSMMFTRIQIRDLEVVITNRDFATLKEDEQCYNYDIKEHGKAVSEHMRLSTQLKALEKQINQDMKRIDGMNELLDFIDEAKGTKKGKAAKKRATGHIENQIE